jgi:hypothetical protein
MNKKSLLIIIFSLITYPALCAANDWRPLILESYEKFAIRADAKGKVKVIQNSAHIKIESGHFSIPPISEGPRKLSGIQIGLAYEYKPGAWDIIGISPVITQNIIIPIKQNIEIKPFETSV